MVFPQNDVVSREGIGLVLKGGTIYGSFDQG
jgi:hypothetical protein